VIGTIIAVVLVSYFAYVVGYVMGYRRAKRTTVALKKARQRFRRDYHG
jgi:hypothetical protein